MKRHKLDLARQASEKAVTATSASWDDLAAFLAVARCGGLSAAARTMATSAPTLGRRMHALERSLGRELFVRRTHGYDLTPDGTRLCDELHAVEAAIARATSAEDTLPLVKIAAGTWTTLALANVLPSLLGDPPDLRVRLIQGEAVLSIAHREATIGFRWNRPGEGGLAGRRLRRVAFAPYAVPGSPEQWIVVRADTHSARWVLARCGNRITAETTAPRLALDLALQGLGRAVLPTFVGDVQPGLVRAGPEIAELAHDRWLVVHNDDRNLPEVRRTLQRIAMAFE